MMSLSRFPMVWPIHRTFVYAIQRAGRRSGRLFDLYNRAWIKAGRFQRAKTKFGATIECDLKDRVPAFIFHFGAWEPDISHWIARRLRPGDLFIDVGSNIGYYTLLASKRVGSSGAVVAIEASPGIYTKLTRSIAANGCQNVRAVNVAVSDNPGKVMIYAGPPENSGATSTLADWRAGTPEAEVLALPLDQILTPSEMQRVRLIKIDVEGAEAPILRQIAGTIHAYPPQVEVLVECSPRGDTGEWAQIMALFFDAGFSAFGVQNDYSAGWYLRWRHPSPLRRLTDLPAGQTDVLFTRTNLLESI